MRPGSAALLERGGLNAQFCNALAEATPRNGVLTAVEDYLRESGEALRFLKVPGYAGLGILCPAPLEAENGELAAFLKAWDLPPAVRQFYEQLDLLRSLLLTNVMEVRQAGGPPVADGKEVGDRSEKGRPAPAVVGLEGAEAGAARRRPRGAGAGPSLPERRPPTSGPIGAEAPAEPWPGPPGPGVAIRYDDDGFVVTDKNLMGRRVAGRDFLDAYLRHGRWDELVTMVANAPSEKSIQQLFAIAPGLPAPGPSAPRRRPAGLPSGLLPRASRAPAVPLRAAGLRFAWARQHGGPGAFAPAG